MFDVGCCMLDVGCWMLDVGCSMLDFPLPSQAGTGMGHSALPPSNAYALPFRCSPAHPSSGLRTPIPGFCITCV